MDTIRTTKTIAADVCVVGGGPAGFCAAIAAARNGAKTVLVEKYGALGGAMTLGGIPAPALFHAHGTQVISGIGWELMERLAKEGNAVLPQPPFRGRHPKLAVRVNAFEAAAAMDDMCLEAGVSLMFHRQATYAIMENGAIANLALAGKTGLLGVSADVYVDCTGDADIVALSGARYEQGAVVQPGSFNVLFEGINLDRVDRKQADERYAIAVEEGRLSPCDVWSGRGKHCGSIFTGKGSNLNHVYPLDGASSESRACAEVDARRSVRRLLRWMKAEVPGCENAYVAAMSPESWPRESRRLVGLSTVTGADYLRGVSPPDAICYSFYPIDIHTHEGHALINEFHEEGRVPGIPYGALVPKEGPANLLVAGRCISADRAAQSAVRIQASCMATGQAAGTAAATAQKAKRPVSMMEVDYLREILAAQGAIVPD